MSDQKITDTFLNQDYIQLDPKNLPLQEIYKLLVNVIVPRPIALVSTINSRGQGNLAPFSFFNGAY